MRTSTLLLAASCIVSSALAAPRAQNSAETTITNVRYNPVARLAKEPPQNSGYWQHHDGDTEDETDDDCTEDDDTDDDGWDTEAEATDCEDEKEAMLEYWRGQQEEQSSDPVSDESDRPDSPPTLPVAKGQQPAEEPDLPAEEPEASCVPGPTIRNSGFEDDYGSLKYWWPSNRQNVLIDSQNGEPNRLGSHSALFVLDNTEVAHSIRQRIRVCPNSVYKVYLAIKILALGDANAAPGTQPTGSLANNAECNIFIGMDGGNATIAGAALVPGAFTTFTTANTFNTGPDDHANFGVVIVCSESAFNDAAEGAPPSPGYFYLDDVQLVAQEPEP